MEHEYRLSRLVRTQSSEIYLIWSGEKRIGQVDIHYAHDTIHATVILEADLSDSEEATLIGRVDDEIVVSYLPRFERDDFVAHVFRGEQINRYTDASGAVEELEDMEEVSDYGDGDDDDDDDGLDGLFGDDTDPFRDG